MRQPRIGEGQAWFYHDDSIILLWTCNLLPRYRVTDPVEDHNLHALWDGFEAFLRRRFSQARQIMVPAWNSAYEQTLWRPFIHGRGFVHRSPAGLPGRALIKQVRSR